MNHNETIWRLTADRPVADVLHGIQRRLESAGWKTMHVHDDYLRMSRDAAELSLRARSAQEIGARSSPKTPTLDVRYVDRMTQAEKRAALDELLAHNTSPEVLMCLENQWSADQLDRVLKAVESRPPRTPQAALALANFYHRLKRDDNARREVLHACALLRTIAQTSDLDNAIKSLAKDLGDEKLVEKPLEPRMLDELGFIELKPGIPVPAQEIGLEEPVHFYVKTSDGSLKIVSLRAFQSGTSSGGKPSYQLAFVESGGPGRSWGTTGPAYSLSLEDGCNASFALNPLGAGERFQLTAQVSGPAPKPAPPDNRRKEKSKPTGQ
jgi:hypothetical protein